MSKQVNVTVCDGGAVYVNDSRITGRDTKWGARETLAEFSCAKSDVVAELSRHGFVSHISYIDTAPYSEQVVTG